MCVCVCVCECGVFSLQEKEGVSVDLSGQLLISSLSR